MGRRLSKVLFPSAVMGKKKTANYFIRNLITMISIFISHKRYLLPLSTCLRATYWPCPCVRNETLHLKGFGRNPSIWGDLVLILWHLKWLIYVKDFALLVFLTTDSYYNITVTITVTILWFYYFTCLGIYIHVYIWHQLSAEEEKESEGTDRNYTERQWWQWKMSLCQ